NYEYFLAPFWAVCLQHVVALIIRIIIHQSLANRLRAILVIRTILEPQVMEHQTQCRNSTTISSTCRMLMQQTWSRKNFYWPVIKIKLLTAYYMQMITVSWILNIILRRTWCSRLMSPLKGCSLQIGPVQHSAISWKKYWKIRPLNLRVVL